MGETSFDVILSGIFRPLGSRVNEKHRQGDVVPTVHLKRDQATDRMNTGFIQFEKRQPDQRCMAFRESVDTETRCFRGVQRARTSSRWPIRAESFGSRDRSSALDCSLCCRPRSFSLASIAHTDPVLRIRLLPCVSHTGWPPQPQSWHFSCRRRCALRSLTIDRTKAGGKPHRMPTSVRRNRPDGPLPERWCRNCDTGRSMWRHHSSRRRFSGPGYTRWRHGVLAR